MTLATTTRRVSYQGYGTTGPYPFPYYFFQNTDLVVTLADASGNVTTLVYGTDYTVTGASVFGGGSVTTTAVVSSSVTIEIQRTLPFTQLSSFRTQGPGLLGTIEAAFDRARMIDQQLSDTVVDLTAIVTTNTTNITTILNDITNINISITNINVDLTSLTSIVNTHTSEITILNNEMTIVLAEIAGLQAGTIRRRLAQTYAAGSHTYTPTAGTIAVEFEGWSGGGGGAIASGVNPNGSLGGESGGYAWSQLPVNTGDKYTIVVGPGGAGDGTPGGTGAVDGGTTSVTRVSDSRVALTISGGQAGQNISAGGGGVATGDVAINGAIADSRSDGFVRNVVLNTANSGFSSRWVICPGGDAPRGGSGGHGLYINNPSLGEVPGTVPGGGGGAACDTVNNVQYVSDGADGQVLVWEWR